MNNKDEKLPPRTTKDLQSFAQTIKPLTQKILGPRGFAEADILSHWEDIVGSQLAENTRPLHIEFPREKKNNGRLFLQTNSGAFALEISHREKYILNKINTYFGYEAVSAINILQNNNIEITPSNSNRQENLSKQNISSADKDLIKNLTNGINNQNLKEILIKLGHSVFADNQKKEKKDNEI